MMSVFITTNRVPPDKNVQDGDATSSAIIWEFSTDLSEQESLFKLSQEFFNRIKLLISFIQKYKK